MSGRARSSSVVKYGTARPPLDGYLDSARFADICQKDDVWATAVETIGRFSRVIAKRGGLGNINCVVSKANLPEPIGKLLQAVKTVPAGIAGEGIDRHWRDTRGADR